MKIYFAGSITGGRQDQELYLEIISLLKNYGDVLTEHVGDPKILDDGERLDAATIYHRDLEWLEQSDVVVAEVTTQSLGVGYELGIAEKLNKRVVCLYRPNEKRISAMVLGNSYFEKVPYASVTALEPILNKFFNL